MLPNTGSGMGHVDHPEAGTQVACGHTGGMRAHRWHAGTQVACGHIEVNGSGEDPNSMSSRQHGNAARRCQKYNKAENPAEWIDSPNELIDRPHNGRRERKDAQRGFWCPLWDIEPPHDRQGDGDRQCDVWPLGNRESTSSAVDEHPSKRFVEISKSRVFA